MRVFKLCVCMTWKDWQQYQRDSWIEINDYYFSGILLEKAFRLWMATTKFSAIVVAMLFCWSSPRYTHTFYAHCKVYLYWKPNGKFYKQQKTSVFHARLNWLYWSVKHWNNDTAHSARFLVALRISKSFILIINRWIFENWILTIWQVHKARISICPLEKVVCKDLSFFLSASHSQSLSC